MIDHGPLRTLAHGIHRSVAALADMPGGASTRRYFRVTFDDASTAVAMFVPDDRPEEIQKGAPSGRWPFLEVRELLADRGVRVPALLADGSREGWLLLEDLGDITLAAHLAQHPLDKPGLYTRAVTDLAHAQRGLSDLPEGSVIRTRAFDADLLRWELDHFREFGLDARGKSLGADARAVFDAIADRLARRIAEWPRGFTHRDYQSRNLMIVGHDLVWLDFQDALMGPRVYDLVALLNDSYQEFDRPFVEARLDDYARALHLDVPARTALGRQFDLVTVQRKLKDAGRFVFIDRVKHNPAFLPFVTPTLRKVGAALLRLGASEEDMAQLEAILRRVVGDEL